MPPERVKVPVPDELRYEILASLGLPGKVSRTIEEQVITKPGPPLYILPHGDLPVGTVSQLLKYRVKSNGWRLLTAHQYVLPTGEIRGGPDPLYINLDDVVICRAKDFPT